MKKLLLLLVVLALGGAGFWAWQTKQAARELLLSGIPERPQGPALPAALADRLANAEHDVRVSRSVAGLAELARLYHANGHFPQALQAYAVLAELEPAQASWFHLPACIQAGYGALDEAIPLLRRAAELDPRYVPVLVRLGDVLLKANRETEAEAAYQSALTQEPDNAYALQGLARVDMQRGNWEQARTRLEKAAAKSRYAIGGDLLVTVYEKTGRETLARSLRARNKASGAFYDIPDPRHDALFSDCYDPYRATIAAGAAGRYGDIPLCLKLLEHVKAVAPDYALARYQLGLVLIDLERLPQALAELKKSAELDPSFSDTWVRLVGLQAKMGDELGAALTVDKGLKLCPHSPRLHSEKAARLEKAGRLREAEEFHRKVITLRPDESWCYFDLAKFLYNRNRDAEAAAVLQQGLVIEPEEPRIMSVLAFDAIAGGRREEAKSWLARMRAQPRTPPESLEELVKHFRGRFGAAP